MFPALGTPKYSGLCTPPLRHWRAPFSPTALWDQPLTSRKEKGRGGEGGEEGRGKEAGEGNKEEKREEREEKL